MAVTKQYFVLRELRQNPSTPSIHSSFMGEEVEKSSNKLS
jgi:hypothetical protein